LARPCPLDPSGNRGYARLMVNENRAALMNNGVMRLSGFRLLVALSAALIAAWAIYLIIAPSPETLPLHSTGQSSESREGDKTQVRNSVQYSQ
jgi:predicted acyltransferase